MRTAWTPVLCLLSLCSCIRVKYEDLGVDRAAATRAVCTAACTAAGHEDCTKTCRKCDFNVNNLIYVGGYALTCAAAMPAACGMDVGHQTCMLKCTGLETLDTPPESGNDG